MLRRSEPVVEAEVSPPSRALVEAYAEHLGVPRERYREQLPPHLFAQWSYAVVARALAGAPYPLHRIVTSACRLEQRAPLSRDRLRLTAEAEAPRRQGCCVELPVRIRCGTRAEPDALEAILLLSVPGDGEPSPPTTIPCGAHAVATWDLDATSARTFAMLTGDLNPLHWLPGYGRLLGFGGRVAHGLSLLARTAEALVDDWRVLDVRFPEALVLPARVSLFVEDAELFVGEEPGGVACLAGSYAR